MAEIRLDTALVQWHEDDFATELKASGEALLEELSEKGAARSREIAPVGKKIEQRPDAKPIKDSIKPFHTDNIAGWECTTRHAVITEDGGATSLIPANVSFFWEKEGRRWRPGAPTQLIKHPATAPQPYLRPAFEEMMVEWESIAERVYAK